MALKGNGVRITSHFPSLARYVEYAGAPDGLAGGSSGAVSSFFYESISMNPMLKDVSEQEKRKILSLLLKSVPRTITSSIEIVVSEELAILSKDPFYEALNNIFQSKKKKKKKSKPFFNFLDLLKNMAPLFENEEAVRGVLAIIDAVDESGIYPGLSALFTPRAREYLINNAAAMKAIALQITALDQAKQFSIDTIIPLVPDDLLAIYLEKIYTDLFTAKYPLKFLPRLLNKEFVDSLIIDRGKWYVDKNRIGKLIHFVSTLDTDINYLLEIPAMLNFDLIVEVTAALNDFYAYGGNVDGAEEIITTWREIFQAQVGKAKGKSWNDLPAEWKEDYKNRVLKPFWQKTLSGSIPLVTKRDKDFVGDHMHIAVANGVLYDDDLVEDFKRLKTKLNQRTTSEDVVKFEIDQFLNKYGKMIDYFRAGYFTGEDDAVVIAANISKYDDPKSKRYLNLGKISWSKALVMSVSEPGFGAIETASHYGYDKMNFVSLAGWSDLAPVQILKSMQCKTTAIIARAGKRSTLSVNLHRVLGEDDQGIDRVHDYKQAASSNSVALSEADIVFCNNAQAYLGLDLTGLTYDGYNPTEIIDRRENDSASSKYLGCGGVSPMPFEDNKLPTGDVKKEVEKKKPRKFIKVGAISFPQCKPKELPFWFSRWGKISNKDFKKEGLAKVKGYPHFHYRICRR